MKKCKECGKDFEPENLKGIFCSPKCRQKDYRKSINLKLKSFEELKDKLNSGNNIFDNTVEEIWSAKNLKDLESIKKNASENQSISQKQFFLLEEHSKRAIKENKLK